MEAGSAGKTGSPVLVPVLGSLRLLRDINEERGIGGEKRKKAGRPKGSGTVWASPKENVTHGY